MKRYSIGIVASLILAGCSTSISANAFDTTTATTATTAIATDKVITTFTLSGNSNKVLTQLEIEQLEREALVEAEYEKQRLLASNLETVNSAVSKVKKQVGKTWYVFSGSTPSGWDCSGLVMWTYEQMGVQLEHRASKQANAGKKVKEPKYGDIVAFTYKGSSSAYHTAIYLGEDQMLHAGGGKGETTQVASISKFAGNHTKVSYVRLIDTP